MSWARRLIAGILTSAICGVAVGAAGAPAPAPDADTIFSRARDAASTQHCPARLEYDIVVGAQVGGRVEFNQFHASYLYDSDYLHVNALSDEELRHPYVPHGTNVAVTFFLGMGSGGAEVGFLRGLSRALTAKLNHDGPPPELMGVPLLTPSYTFGLSRPPAGELPQARDAAPSPVPSSLRIIGSTHTISRDYALEILGIEKYSGGEAYHLKLTPLREPLHNRLRQLWVDAASFAVLAAVTQGNFSDGPPTRTQWLTTYQDVGGCRVIDREVAAGTLDYGPARKYEKTTIFFDVIDDPAAYRLPLLQLRRTASGDDLVEPDDPATSQAP